MTNEPRDAFGLVRELPKEETPCFVHHEDAGGLCARPSTVEVYGLPFCEAHSEEARLGAYMEAYQDAAHFFDRFRSPHVPALTGLVDRELGSLLGRMTEGAANDAEHQCALARAYPNPPEAVRERTRIWQSDEEPGRPTVFDVLMDSLVLLHKLMRLAFEERQTWLVEVLEEERESVAAQAACALRLDAEREAVQP